MSQRSDPPAQLFETYLAMLVRESIDDVLDFRGATSERIK